MPIYHFKKISGATSSGFDGLGCAEPYNAASRAGCSKTNILRSGCLCYFNMDDTGNAAVDSINGIQLAVTGSGMTAGVAGYRNTAWQNSDTSGASYLSGTQNVFALPNKFTLNALVNPASLHGENCTIVEFGSYDTTSGFGLFINGSRLVTARINQEYLHYGSTPLTLGSWAMLTMTYDGSTMKTYINGTLDTSWNPVAPPTETEMINAFSRIPGGGNTSEWWCGILDEIGLWNYAMTQEQITALQAALLDSGEGGTDLKCVSCGTTENLNRVCQECGSLMCDLCTDNGFILSCYNCGETLIQR